MNGSQLNGQYNTMSHRPSPFVNSSQRYICGRSYCYHLTINTIQYRMGLLLLSSSQRYICGRSYCYQLSINLIQYRIDLLLLSSSQIYICGRSYCYQLSINAIQYRIDLLLLSIFHRDVFAGDHSAINYLSIQYNIA